MMVQIGVGSWTVESVIWAWCLWYRSETGCDAEGGSGDDGTDRGRVMDGGSLLYADGAYGTDMKRVATH